jgi:dihydroneopterin aldolase
MGKVKINSLKLYGKHGCNPLEKLIGNQFIFDIELEADLSKAREKDDISSVPDYTQLIAIVKEENAIRSKLLEHLAYRILHKVKASFSTATSAKISIQKANPPIGENIHSVSVEIEELF